MLKKNHSWTTEAGIGLVFTLLAFVLALPLASNRYAGVGLEDFVTLSAEGWFFGQGERGKTPALSAEVSALKPAPGLLKTVSHNTQGQPRFSAAAAKYESMIERAARRHSVSPLLVKAVIQAESNFNPGAVSQNGAVGLMQLLPSTARSMGFQDPLDPQNNIMAGTRYLKTLLNLYDDDEALAVAAYNAGPDKLRQFGGRVPPYRETLAFVDKVMLYYHANLGL